MGDACCHAAEQTILTGVIECCAHLQVKVVRFALRAAVSDDDGHCAGASVSVAPPLCIMSKWHPV